MNLSHLEKDQREQVENLLNLLTNDETALETAREHLEIDPKNSKAFQPELKIKEDSPLNILNNAEAEKGLMGFFNARSRRSRERLFNKRLKRNPNSFVIVSEGDSWFQYPVLLKDIIDHLNEVDEFAIRSFGFGGDWLSNILEESEYINAIKWHNPKVFLISGGGNDIIGQRLKKLLHPFNIEEPDRTPEEYLTQEFEKALADLKYLYNRLFRRLTNEFPELHIICHGYDYGMPGKEKPIITGSWLENPMQDIGIKDHTLQRSIVKQIIDRFNVMLKNLVDTNFSDKKIHYIDCRNTIGDREWFDELHPKNFGFLKVAEKFKQQIFKIRRDNNI